MPLNWSINALEVMETQGFGTSHICPFFFSRKIIVEHDILSSGPLWFTLSVLSLHFFHTKQNKQTELCLNIYLKAKKMNGEKIGKEGKGQAKLCSLNILVLCLCLSLGS